MRVEGMKATVLATCAALGIGLPMSADAALLQVPVIFSVEDASLWGPGGGGVGFQKIGSAGPFNYDFGASAGTLSAGFAGTAIADYQQSVRGRGTTSISLRFGGPGLFGFDSLLGVHGRLGVSLGSSERSVCSTRTSPLTHVRP